MFNIQVFQVSEGTDYNNTKMWNNRATKTVFLNRNVKRHKNKSKDYKFIGQLLLPNSRGRKDRADTETIEILS